MTSCCFHSGGDDTHPENQLEIAEHWEEGSIKNKPRSCTDVLLLLLLIASWAAMTILGFCAVGWIESSQLKSGNPRRILHATDYKGDVCGVSESVKHKPDAYYLYTGAVICIDGCPTVTDTTKFYCYDIYQDAADSNSVDAWNYVSQGYCMYQTECNKVINRCISKDMSDAVKSQVDTANTGSTVPYGVSVSDSRTWFHNFVADIWTLRGYVFGFGLGVSVLVAFSYLVFLRLPGMLFVTIWSMV